MGSNPAAPTDYLSSSAICFSSGTPELAGRHARTILTQTDLSEHRLTIAALLGFIESADRLRQRICFRLMMMRFAVGRVIPENCSRQWVFAGLATDRPRLGG